MNDRGRNCQSRGERGEEIPQSEYVEDYYEVQRRRYLDRDTWARGRISDVLSVLQPSPGERILDVGCGIGMISLECRKRGSDVTAIDYSEVAVRMARALEREVLGGSEIEYRCMDAGSLMSLSGLYDKAVAADSIEHISKRLFETFLREVRLRLKDEGVLVLYTPNGPVVQPNLIQKVVRLVGLLPYFRLRDAKDIHPAAPEDALDEKYEYLHVDIKTGRYLKRTLAKYEFRVEKIVCSRGFSRLLRLPYPFNVLWGGHLCVTARKI